MATLVIDIDAKGAYKIKDLKDGLEGLDTKTKSVNTSFANLGRTIGAVASFEVARKVVAIADSWTLVSNRLKLVTSSTADLVATQKKLFDLSQATHQEYASTANLYTRLARATQDLGVSQDDLLTVTKAVGQSLLISGASTQEAQSAITQLSQAMASGVLRGEEYNSISENGSRIAEALAVSLGVTRGELRKMAEEGLLTTEVVVNALKGQADAIEGEFGQMETTVGQAWQNLENSLGNYINKTNEATDATNLLAKAMQGASEIIDDYGGAVNDSLVRAFYVQFPLLHLLTEATEDDTTKRRDNFQAIIDQAEALHQYSEVTKKAIGYTDQILEQLEQKVKDEEADAWAIEKGANARLDAIALENQLRDEYNATHEVVKTATENTNENTDAIKANTEAKEANAIASSAGSIPPIGTGQSGGGTHDLSAGTTYTVVTQPLYFFASVIDKSVTNVTNFNTEIERTTNHLGTLSTVLSDLEQISSILNSDLTGRANDKIFGSSNTALDFNEALQATSDAITALNDDNTNIDLAKAYKEASDDLINSLGFLDDTSKFANKQSQEFEKARVLREIQALDEATAGAKEENDDNLEALNNIIDAINGTDSRDAINAVKNALDGADGVADKTQAVKDALGINNSYVRGNLDQYSTKGKVSQVVTTVLFKDDPNGAQNYDGTPVQIAYGERQTYQYYKSGGYTGNMGDDEVAGLVHGQEYVINASTTNDLGLNGSGDVFKEISRKLNLLDNLFEINKTTKKSLTIQRTTLEELERAI